MKKVLQGSVIDTKMSQTAVVEVEAWKTHRLYKKRYRRTKRYLADNPDNQYQAGDKVTIAESRPISKLKHWRIIAKVEKK